MSVTAAVRVGQVVEAGNALLTLLELIGVKGRVPRFVRKLGEGFTRALVAAPEVEAFADFVDVTKHMGAQLKVTRILADGTEDESMTVGNDGVAFLDSVHDGVRDAAVRFRDKLR